jgi:hypothetical protein
VSAGTGTSTTSDTGFGSTTTDPTFGSTTSDPTLGGTASDPTASDTLASGGVADAAIVGSWTGESDEVPTTSSWTVRSLTVPPGTGGSTGTSLGTGTSFGGSGATVTYTNRIQSIFQQNCTGCHSAGGSQSGTPLDTYDRARALGSASAARMRDTTRPMPPGSLLPSDIAQDVANWAAAGSPQ